MYDLYDVKERLSCMAWCSISEFCWEVNEEQVNTRWMTIPAAPDGILENVNCDCKSGCSTRCCACQKNRIEVYCLKLCHRIRRPEGPLGDATCHQFFVRMFEVRHLPSQSYIKQYGRMRCKDKKTSISKILIVWFAL